MAGFILAKATQKSVYKLLMRNSAKEDRTTTTVHVAMVRHAAQEQNGAFPSVAAVWASTWHKDLKSNDQELLWKSIHGAYKIGKYWENMHNYEHRGRCAQCGADRESMDHILFECDAPGRQQIWDLAHQMWEKRNAGPWPTGNQFGVALAAGLMRFNTDGIRNKGAERFFKILFLTTWRTIWNIRCQRRIRNKQISQAEATARWWKGMSKRLDLDQAASSKRFDHLAISRQTVHNTWHPVLVKELLPEGEWIGRGAGVLVGSISQPGEEGIT